MALVCDSSLDFASPGTGYTFDSGEVEFTGGVARLIAGVIGWSTIETPNLDTTTWDDISKVTITQVEAVGAAVRFLVSFDAGSTWQRYTSSGWRVASLASISTVGMARETLEAIREWPATDDLAFAVALYRQTSGSGTATVSQITVCHGTATLTASTEPTGDDELGPDDPEDGPFDYPDFALTRAYEQEGESIETENGTVLGMSMQTLARSRMTLRWNNRTTAERLRLLFFIIDHQDEAFLWTPRNAANVAGTGFGHDDFEAYPTGPITVNLAGGEGFAQPMRWVFGEPTSALVDVGIWNLEVEAVEVQPQYSGWVVGRNYYGVRGYDDFEEYDEGAVTIIDGGTGFPAAWVVAANA